MHTVRVDRLNDAWFKAGRWRRRAFGAGLLFAVLGAMGLSPAQAADEHAPPTADAEVEALIEQLGADRFADRERAQRALVRLGLPALERLEVAADHTDPEIRRRARAVLTVVQRMDLEARLEAFVRADNPDDDPHLPYWPRFRELVGDSRGARAIFAEIVRDELPLLQAAEEEPQDASQLLSTRARRLQDLNTGVFGIDEEPTLGNVLALLLVGADVRVPVGDWGVVIANFSSNPVVTEALQSEEQRPVAQKIIAAWTRRDFSPHQYVLYVNMMIAISNNLPDAIHPARALLKLEGAISHQRLYALLTVAQHGCIQDEPLVERWLTDENVVQTDQGNRILQLRDVALATSIRLYGLDVGEFGFTAATPAAPNAFNPASLGFTSEEDRARAITAWHDWKAENAPAEAPSED